MRRFFTIRLIIISGLSIFFLSGTVFANWGKFDEGMSDSMKSGKYAIVDFYTDWCGWCKKMEKEVFSQSDVSSRLSREFVTIRIDAESATPLMYKGQKTNARNFTGMMRVQGFPTLIVFNSKGDPVTQLPGYVDAKTFMHFLDYVKKEGYKKQTFEDYYRTVAR